MATASGIVSTTFLPELALEDWQESRDTLHLWLQIVGKVKLASAHPLNHWWHVTYRVDPRGLTTGLMWHEGEHGLIGFRIDFDLIEHQLVITTSEDGRAAFPLEDGLSVAAFDRQLHTELRGLGVDVQIQELPFGTPISNQPFPEDESHRAYDPDYIQRFHWVLLFVENVFEEFAGWFCGKQSPVQVFWHSFDLAHTRFSGRPAPPLDADSVTQEAYSHELISFGFWPGDLDTKFPAFYSYTAPEPATLSEQPLEPATAYWHDTGRGHLAILPYDEVRGSADPRATLLRFLDSGYQAGATVADWALAELDSSWCPVRRTPSNRQFGLGSG
jgi:hypothetical protein